MHVLEFMGRLSERTGCDLILDLGHLLAYQLAAGLDLDGDLERALAAYPLERVIEIHLAGGVVTGQAYFDDHSQPVREELFGLLERILPRCTGLRAVTFEGDGHPDEVAAITLRRLRSNGQAAQRAGRRRDRPTSGPFLRWMPTSPAAGRF